MLLLLLLEELLLLCDVRGGVPVLVVGRGDVGKRRVRRVPRKLLKKHTVSLIARMYENKKEAHLLLRHLRRLVLLHPVDERHEL